MIETLDELEALARLCESHETWLTERVLEYGRRTGYARYTSTLLEAWRQSIQGLTEALVETVEHDGVVHELSPEEDPQNAPGTAFGILEARRHRDRGISLEMFLGLTKYYRQSYRDLVRESAPPACREAWERFVDLFFDRFEIGFCADWAGEYDSAVNLALMQRAMRHLTNEKNRHLTVLESLPFAVLVHDHEGSAVFWNRRAHALLRGDCAPGSSTYDATAALPRIDALDAAVRDFQASDAEGTTLRRPLVTERGRRLFRIELARIVDVSEKFDGTVVVLQEDDEASDPDAPEGGEGQSRTP